MSDYEAALLTIECCFHAMRQTFLEETQKALLERLDSLTFLLCPTSECLGLDVPAILETREHNNRHSCWRVNMKRWQTKESQTCKRKSLRRAESSGPVQNHCDFDNLSLLLKSNHYHQCLQQRQRRW
eukprot:scaffold7832_cov103-Cylindrotheca_fusiformis.AAC.6